MDNFTWTITIGLSLCIAVFGLVVTAGGIYGILVWYPRYRKRKVAALKAAGKQGEATILRLPGHTRENYARRRAVFIRVPIGLEIRVPGIDTYEVDKTFNIPAEMVDKLEAGKVVAVWVDPKNPRDLDKIVIHIQ